MCNYNKQKWLMNKDKEEKEIYTFGVISTDNFIVCL